MQTPTWVKARHRIEQSPLDNAPAVPRGTRGHVEDVADGFWFVDFDAPYGVVMCKPSEIRA